MKISTSYDMGRLTVYLSGELDHHEAKSTVETINELLDEYMPRDCVLELSELSFMDSSGIAIIIRLNNRMKIIGGKLWIENPSRQPMRVLDASGIDRLVTVAIRQ